MTQTHISRISLSWKSLETSLTFHPVGLGTRNSGDTSWTFIEINAWAGRARTDKAGKELENTITAGLWQRSADVENHLLRGESICPHLAV